MTDVTPTDRRAADERDADTQLPLHAAGQRPRLTISLILQVEQTDHLLNLALQVLAAFQLMAAQKATTTTRF